MKNLKLVFAVVMSMMILASCTSKQDVLAPKPTEQTSVEKKPQRMNGLQFTATTGIKLPFLDYGDGNPMSRGKKKAAEANIAFWAQDLAWLQTGAVKQITVSENAEWVGITNFASTTSNDGATVPTGCNGNYNSPPGAGATFTCNGNGPGLYRGFTSDFPVVDPITGDLVWNVHTTDFNQQL